MTKKLHKCYTVTTKIFEMTSAIVDSTLVYPECIANRYLPPERPVKKIRYINSK